MLGNNLQSKGIAPKFERSLQICGAHANVYEFRAHGLFLLWAGRRTIVSGRIVNPSDNRCNSLLFRSTTRPNLTRDAVKILGHSGELRSNLLCNAGTKQVLP
jgi:hypothetical protein